MTNNEFFSIKKRRKLLFFSGWNEMIFHLRRGAADLPEEVLREEVAPPRTPAGGLCCPAACMLFTGAGPLLRLVTVLFVTLR
jgi:hypothetical protein